MGLLWTTVHNHRGPTYSTTVEKRAPTDESVRLLKEMEGEARDKVIQAIPIRNNALNGVVIESLRSEATEDREVFIRFQLNGRTFESRHVIDDRDLILDDHKAFEMFAEEVSKAIMGFISAQLP